jgi:hypothetical protein
MKVEMLGHTYEVKEVDGRGEDWWGRINNSAKVIELDKDLSDSCKHETLFHEIIEGVNWWGDLNMEHHKLSLMSTLLFSVMKGNPKVRKILFDE